MEGVAGEVDGVELGIGDLDPFGVLVPIQFGAHREPSVGRRRRDQLDDRAIGSQWLAPPINADEWKEAVFDFVPFAGSRREMSNGNGKSELVSQLLQFDFP
jgi:hypothetical protein